MEDEDKAPANATPTDMPAVEKTQAEKDAETNAILDDLMKDTAVPPAPPAPVAAAAEQEGMSPTTPTSPGFVDHIPGDPNEPIKIVSEVPLGANSQVEILSPEELAARGFTVPEAIAPGTPLAPGHLPGTAIIADPTAADGTRIVHGNGTEVNQGIRSIPPVVTTSPTPAEAAPLELDKLPASVRAELEAGAAAVGTRRPIADVINAPALIPVGQAVINPGNQPLGTRASTPLAAVPPVDPSSLSAATQAELEAGRGYLAQREADVHDVRRRVAENEAKKRETNAKPDGSEMDYSDKRP